MAHGYLAEEILQHISVRWKPLLTIFLRQNQQLASFFFKDSAEDEKGSWQSAELSVARKMASLLIPSCQV